MNLNKAILIGRLTSDPNIKTIPSGQMVCSFGLATNRTWTNQTTKQRETKAEFHNIVIWGRLAEIASQYLKKGSLTLIEGRIQTRSWQDQTGNKKYRTEIVAENIQLGPRINLQQGFQPQNQTEQTEQKEQQTPDNKIPIIEEGKKNDEEEIKVEDIPF